MIIDRLLFQLLKTLALFSPEQKKRKTKLVISIALMKCQNNILSNIHTLYFFLT